MNYTERTTNNYNYTPNTPEIDTMIDTANDTLSRWDTLLNRGALVNRISLDTFNKMDNFVYKEYGQTEATSTLAKNYYIKIRELRVRFQDMFINSIKSPKSSDVAIKNQLEEIARQCLKQKNLSKEFQIQLEKCLKAVSIPETRIIPTDGVNHFKLLPDDIFIKLMGYFDLKDLGRIACVFKKFKLFAEMEECARFQMGPSIKFFRFLSKSYTLRLNYDNPDLRGKHVFKIVEKHFKEKTEVDFSKFAYILLCESTILNSQDKITETKFAKSNFIQIILKNL